MKLTYIFVWLACGGLVALGLYVVPSLLKFAEHRDDAEEEQLWRHLLHRGKS